MTIFLCIRLGIISRSQSRFLLPSPHMGYLCSPGRTNEPLIWNVQSATAV